MPTFLTPGRHGYAVQFSPQNMDLLAVATGQFYGLAGGGTLFFLELSSDGLTIVELQKLEWTDGLFDVAWNSSGSLAAVASGDGCLLVSRVGCSSPLRVIKAHEREACSVQWSDHHLLSASWDTTIKMWDCEKECCVLSWRGHSELVYCAHENPFSKGLLASVSGDNSLKMWTKWTDRPIADIKAHDAEVLSCEWSACQPNLIATGGADGLIKGWDQRNLSKSLFTLKGCECAIRRVRFSPHAPNILAAVSYDFSTRIWDFSASSSPLESVRHHSEFNYGLAFNPSRRHQVADCGWDSLVHVFTPRGLLKDKCL